VLGYIFDFAMIAALIVGITALNGVITNSIGENLFGGKNRSEFKNATDKTQVGWKPVGGHGK